MTFDDQHSFRDPALIALTEPDRSALARLLAPVPGPGRPAARASLDPERAELAKWLYDQRRSRERFLPEELFGEPAWDILLILYWARHSQRRLSVSAVCASAGAPATTALRYVEHLCRSGYAAKEPHPTDRRVSWLALSDEADRKIGDYLDRLSGAGTERTGFSSAH